MKVCKSNKILRKTTKGSRDFSCLTSGKCGKCEIEKHFDDNMLYVKNPKDIESVACPYKMSYGKNIQGHICTCPTLYDLYEKKKLR
jgi:hypothetical protein